jgi:hypothetical protein
MSSRFIFKLSPSHTESKETQYDRAEGMCHAECSLLPGVSLSLLMPRYFEKQENSSLANSDLESGLYDLLVIQNTAEGQGRSYGKVYNAQNQLWRRAMAQYKADAHHGHNEQVTAPCLKSE